jgi:hypothetical protein
MGIASQIMVRSQIANLTLDPFFGHNLCSNGSCEPILDIYVVRNFQWYKEKSSIHWVLTLVIVFWKFGNHRDSNSQSGSSFGSVRVPSHFPTLLGACMTLRLPSWPAILQALALVVSPRLGLWHSTYTRSFGVL